MTKLASIQSNTRASLSIRRVGVFLGAQVGGVDLTKPLDERTLEEIRQALAEYGVLVVPDQLITSEDLMAFGRYFGELSVHPFSTSTEENPELIVFDNKEGNPPGATDVWHSDETFRECPPVATALCAKIVPEVGGDTVYASMSAVYEGLSDRMQKLLSGLEAVHDFKPFKELFPKSREGLAKLRHFEDLYPPVIHPVVTVHPVTGRKVLFVNPQFTLAIKGMEEGESRTILDMLFRKTLVHEYHYRHRWQPNMVVIWDNRSVQHSAVHDYYPHRRLMERVTMKGSRPIAAGAAADLSELRRYLMPPISAFETSRQKRQHEL